MWLVLIGLVVLVKRLREWCRSRKNLEGILKECIFTPFNNPTFTPFHFIDVRHVSKIKLRDRIKRYTKSIHLMNNKT